MRAACAASSDVRVRAISAQDAAAVEYCCCSLGSAGSDIQLRVKLRDRVANRRDRLESLTTQEPLRELDIESVLERKHEVDAPVRCQTSAIQIISIGKRIDVDG